MGIKEFIKIAGVPSLAKIPPGDKITRDTGYESILPGNAQNANGLT